jgi:histidinol-phosphate aminotransferase
VTAPRYKWQPTTAEIARRAGIAEVEVVRFDHNTSPFPTAWTAATLADLAGGLNEYPGADYRPLREAAAGYAGVEPDWVVPGAGADELIALCARAWLGPGATTVTTAPTYPLYGIAAAHRGADLRTVPRRAPDLVTDGDALVAAAAGADLVWVCEPNNPTGDRTPDAVLAAVVESAAGIVVLDAAYAEFAGDTWASWVERYPNLVVLHTLSKALGLAAVRVGYALARPDLIDRLDAVRPPGSVSTISAALAARALAEPARVKDTVAALVAGRDALAPRLAALGFRVLASRANFLLCEVGPAARHLEQALMAEGLVVRIYPDDGPLGGYLRFTVRTETEHDRLINALERNLP